MVKEHGNAGQVYDRGMPASSEARSEGLDLKEKIKILRRRRVIAIVTMLLLTVFSALISFSLPPRYVTVASVLIEQRRSNVIDTESVVEETTDSSALAAEINLLRSRTYAQKVVESLDLLSDPRFNPNLQGGAGHLTILAGRLSALSRGLPESWLVAVGLANQAQPPPLSPSDAGEDSVEAGRTAGADSEGPEQSQPPSLPPPGTEAYEYLMQSAVRTLLGGLQIRAGASSLILIEVASDDPHQAAQIADTVAELYVSDQLEIKRQAVDEAINWLKERVAALRERVLQSEGAVVTYQEKYGLTSPATAQQVGGPGQELARIRSERANKEEQLLWVRELRNRGAGLETIAAVLSLSTLAELRQQEMELQRQETMLRMKYGDQHREIVQLDAGTHPINVERQYLAQRVDAEIQGAIRKLEGELAFLRRQGQELEERLAEAETGPNPDARAEVQLRDLERQAAADRELYVAFLARFKEVSEQRNLLQAGARVGSRAGIPGEPEFPKPVLMTAGGFMVSLTLGILLAFLVEYLDSGLRTGRQVERVLGLPNLGFVPRVSAVKRRQRLHRYVIEKPRSGYAEAIRAVQIATVDSVDAGEPTPVVLVTSSLPGEGKTTLALSLGVSAAYSGYKALVVDLDLRRPRLHRETDLQPAAGLVELVAGEKTLDEVLHDSVDHAGLDILPVRRLPASPADLLRSPRMASVLTELRSRYQYIVLDAPPLLGMVDAKLAARLADAVLFVVRWERTREAAARTGLDNLVDRHTPPIGAVLTQVDVRRHAKRGYGEAVQYYTKYEAYYKS